MGVWGYLPSSYPCLVWKAFLRRRLGPDTAPCLPGRVWPAEVSQSQGGDHLLREANWGLAARKQGPGLRHRQIHPGQQGRWKKANEEAGDWSRRARLPCPGHPPLELFGRSANEVRAWSHPHLLRWLSTTVCPLEGLDAGLRPHQSPLNATEVRTRWGRPSGNRFHLCKENGALQARGGRSLQASRCTQKGIAASVSPATTRQPWGHHEMGLPQPSGVTRAIAFTCRWNTQPTSPSLTTSVLKRTSLPAPRRADPLTRHQLSYLNDGGGSGKTTRAIELFRTRSPLVFTPTHRLAKEMRARGVQAQTYHSFFRWSGQTDWTPERMGQKFVPRVIIWDEVCTVPRPTLETLLNWLEGRGQPPQIAGEMPHDWLRGHAAYYEEVEVDHRAKDSLLKALKRRIRLQPDRVQCREMRKALPGCLGWERFVGDWKPCDLILTSRQKVRDLSQRLLFERHEKCFSDVPVPLLYRPKDTRRQNIMVTTPGPLLDGRPDQQEIVLNDVVEVPLKYAHEVLDGKWGLDWALGYALTVHSSQGLTVVDP